MGKYPTVNSNHLGMTSHPAALPCETLPPPSHVSEWTFHRRIPANITKELYLTNCSKQEPYRNTEHLALPACVLTGPSTGSDSDIATWTHKSIVFLPIFFFFLIDDKAKLFRNWKRTHPHCNFSIPLSLKRKMFVLFFRDRKEQKTYPGTLFRQVRTKTTGLLESIICDTDETQCSSIFPVC